MKKIEIISFKKERHECGFRLQLINHPSVFINEYNETSYRIDNRKKELFIEIGSYEKEMDYTTSPASKTDIDDKTYVEKCVIIGNKANIRKFQKLIGYSSLTEDATENQKHNDLLDAIDSLRSDITMLSHEINKLKEFISNINKNEL